MHFLNKSHLVVIVFLSFFAQRAVSQDTLKQGIIDGYASIGYSISNLDDPRSYFDNLLDFYHGYSIPITKQFDFGKTLSLETGILYSDPRIEEMRIGVIAGYIYSPAYARYKDYAGTIDVIGSVNSYQLFLTYQKILWENVDCEIYSLFKPGIDYSTLKITQDVNYTELPEYNYHTKVSASGIGFCGEAMIGMSFPAHSVHYSFEGGYRLFYLEADATEEPVTPENQSRRLPFSIDQSGFVFQCSARFML